MFCRYQILQYSNIEKWQVNLLSVLHMSFMITSKYTNYLVIFVEYTISFLQYCDVKYFEFNIIGLNTTILGYVLSSISIHIIMRIWHII